MNQLRLATAVLAASALVSVGILLSACPGEDTAVNGPDTGAPTATTPPTTTPTTTSTPDGGSKPKTGCLDRPPGSAALARGSTGLPCELIPPGLVLK